MNTRERLKAIPGSYDDFVDSVVGWMERDPKIKSSIEEMLENYPNSTTSDLLMLLWSNLGIGEPLEIVDDASEEAVLITA